MREENTKSSITKKKWFFPAVYLTMAALLLTGVLWYQSLENQVPEANEEPHTEMESDLVSSGNEPGDFDQDAELVMEQQEVIQMPVPEKSQAQIVTKFFDYNADSEDRENALVLYNNKYYQSKGVDIASADGEAFDVTASLSGTVTEVREDPLLGNVIKISHENDLSTYYASIGDVLVETGAEVKQGDEIGSAGRNLYGQASGVHVHFELRRGDQPVNPEDYFNQPLSKVEEPKSEEENADQPDDAAYESDETTGDGSGEEDGAEGNTEEEETTENTESSAAMANA